MIARWRPALLFVVVIVVVGLAGATLMHRFGAFTKDAPGTPADSIPGEIPLLSAAGGWLNGGPLTSDSLAGHPTVLVIWSDSDPRSLEALPAVQGWHQAYARYGVRVVGVHAPDYSFGADPSVPASVARRLGLRFPIALDPEYRIQLRGKSGGPLVVLADGTGRIVASAEGRRIPQLDGAIRDQVRALHPEIVFPGGAADETPSVTPSAPARFAYLGTARVTAGPLSGAHPGEPLTFTTQFRFQEDGVPYVAYPVGRWTPSADGLTAARGGAMNYVAIRTRGERISVVMKPSAEGSSKVWLLADDGWMPEADRDEDVRVDARGATYVEVDEPRLYRIARGGRQRVLKLSPEDPGVTLYVFGFEPQEAPGGSTATAPRAAGR